MENNKKLTLADARKVNNAYTKTKKIDVMNGEYHLNIRSRISYEDIEKIIDDAGKFIQDKEVIAEIGNEPMLKYLTCFTIKHQTDLFDNLEGIKDNMDLLDVFRILLNTGVINDCLNNIKKEDLQTLYDRFNEIMKVARQIGEAQKIAGDIIPKNENM